MGQNKKNRTEHPRVVDELSLQNALKVRHKQDYANVILQLTKRIQAVNQTWARAIVDLMTIEGFRLTWYHNRETNKLQVEVRIGDELEVHEITLQELQEAKQYIEVLLMDKLDHSELIKKHIDRINSDPELP